MVELVVPKPDSKVYLVDVAEYIVMKEKRSMMIDMR